MKNIFLLALLLVSFFSIAQQQEGSYILTKEGERIKIVSGEKIVVNEFGEISYTTKLKYKKIDGDSAKFGGKSKDIKLKKVDKVIDGDRLYVPFQKKDGKKLRMCRIIAKTDQYILGHYDIKETRGHVDGSGTYGLNRERFVILDHEYNALEDYKIYSGKKSEKKNAEGFASIKSKFGDCLNREDYYDIVPIKFIPMKFGRMKIEKGESREFLYNVNQLDCKG